MRLLLIRHGESVDNVAGLYAGSRDSPLTNHGVLQARRLGAHIATRQATIGSVRHIFASNLQRAYRTAEAIAAACRPEAKDSGPADVVVATAPLDVVRLEDLREKDFGSSEGKKFGSKQRDGTDGAESRESMALRTGRFVDAHLVPIIGQSAGDHFAVVVVAHGVILNSLVRALLIRYPLKSVGGQFGDELAVAWSNTGVLQICFEASANSASALSPSGKTTRTLIEQTNNVDHLQGLKKTRGGIGSAQFDSRQRTVDSFFASASKKRKLEDAKD
ncbi:histidine phosphatase superfamily [Poronia punctata]|nr:histidine phosphatase superfamily [Poronia punctata]